MSKAVHFMLGQNLWFGRLAKDLHTYIYIYTYKIYLHVMFEEHSLHLQMIDFPFPCWITGGFRCKKKGCLPSRGVGFGFHHGDWNPSMAKTISLVISHSLYSYMGVSMNYGGSPSSLVDFLEHLIIGWFTRHIEDTQKVATLLATMLVRSPSKNQLQPRHIVESNTWNHLRPEPNKHRRPRTYEAFPSHGDPQ